MGFMRHVKYYIITNAIMLPMMNTELDERSSDIVNLFQQCKNSFKSKTL